MDSADVAIQNVLEHHGIKGMKWGVRTAGRGGSSSSSGGGSGKKTKGPVEVSVKTKSNPQIKTIIRTKGGQNHPAHPDAVASRVVQQKLKKSGMHSLSNEELQKYNTRLNLEQQAHRLTPASPVQRGFKHLTSFMKTPEGQKAVAQGVSTLSKKKVAKGAARVAMTAAMMA